MFALLPSNNFCYYEKYKIDSASVICFGSAGAPLSREAVLLAILVDVLSGF